MLDAPGLMVKNRMIHVDQYPNLALICWNRGGRIIEETEALVRYERNWRFVDEASIPPHERALIDHLVGTHVNGVLLV